MGFFLALFVVGLVYFEISHDAVNNLEKKPGTKSTVVGQGTTITSEANSLCTKKEGGVRYDGDLDLCCSINSGAIVIMGQ